MFVQGLYRGISKSSLNSHFYWDTLYNYLVSKHFVYFYYLFISGVPTTVRPEKGQQAYKDWVFINYTFKRFEGLTQRGVPNARDVVKQ